jgi:hypothetical protein
MVGLREMSPLLTLNARQYRTQASRGTAEAQVAAGVARERGVDHVHRELTAIIRLVVPGADHGVDHALLVDGDHLVDTALMRGLEAGLRDGGLVVLKGLMRTM